MENPDPCDDLLNAGDNHTVNPELRRRLLQRTTGVVRRRRHLRRLGLVAGLAACYLAGIATTKVLAPPPHQEQTSRITRQPTDPDKPSAPKAAPPTPVARAPEIDAQLPPDTLEQLGEFAGREKRPAYFRLAGDGYEKAGDVQAALRCYRLALDSASDADLAIAPTDSYLLMALKNARQKEKNDGKNDA